ncbi:MAG: bifunctional glutamate N-acetyltransferase/amino-acid acetyltransferase ArgJ [Alphaproteobacteria bacterium]|nr:bifunctional glutamate N-acetyltransferase/amino-acid acetyltransferase ArgJ [Alphaproteobacteria bacterium]
MPPTPSPLAPAGFPSLPRIAGVRLAVIEAGIRYKQRPDLLVVDVAPKTQVAGALTRSKTASAPVEWCRAVLKRGHARALVANAGNSNAFTGKAGADAVKRTAARAAQALGCKPGEVFVASTGTIGELIKVDKIEAAIPPAVANLGDVGWQDAANAIRTTDTFAKGVTRAARIGDTIVTINGIAKGSGMIAPDMATMFAFFFTDAKIPASVLQRLVSASCATTFNAVTVDSDTSTSDTLLVFATGMGAKHPTVKSASDRHLRDFKRALHECMLDLAQQIVRDGEGATKFVAVNVSGAASTKAAKTIALGIANSPLVKTALHGQDPNWGRIVAAVGKAGEKANRDKLKIAFGPHPVAAKGAVVQGYVEAPVAEYMKRQELDIHVDVGVGKGKFTVWTCDLSYDYIRINASYRS